MFKAIQKTIFGSGSDDEADDRKETTENESSQPVKRAKIDEDEEKVAVTPEKKASVQTPARPQNAKVSSDGWQESNEEEGENTTTTLKGISQSFEGLFMGDVEISNVMQLLKENPKEEIDFKWHSTLDEETDDCTTTLRIEGMKPPFSSLLFRQFVEKPAPQAALSEPDSFKTAGSTIFINYLNIDTARRQFRRLNGHVWKGQQESNLSVSYTSLKDAQEEIDSHNLLASEEESRLRKNIENQLLESQRKKATEASSRKEREQKTPTKNRTQETDDRPQVYLFVIFLYLIMIFCLF